MKLCQINEMFENVELDASVQQNHTTTGHGYTKRIDGDYYTVGVTMSSIDLGEDRIDADIVNGVYSVTFTGPYTFSTTGKGNFAEVYGFLIASVRDAILNHGVNALYFSGADPGMDLVYNRFIKTFKKMDNPAFQFINVGFDTWISERGLQMMGKTDANNLRAQASVNDTDRDKSLKQIRHVKINSKKYGHLLDKTIMINGESYKVTRLHRAGDGVWGISSNDYDTHHLTPTMLSQMTVQ